MTGHRKESVAGVLVSRVIGIVVFLIVLAVVNYPAPLGRGLRLYRVDSSRMGG